MLRIDIKDIKLEIETNSFVSLIGKSGCGKTTLLRKIAGLDKIKNGIINFNNKLYNNLAIQDREISYIVQNFALFPHMNVLENLLYAKKDNKKADEILQLLEISHLKNLHPKQLSHGEKQRVAIARGLMLSPKLLLLDEVFSALDDDIKYKIFDLIYKVHKELKLTTIFVTHNKNEIYKYSDEIIEFKKDKVIQYKNKNDFISLQGKIHEIDDNIAKIEINGYIVKIPSIVIRNKSES